MFPSISKIKVLSTLVLFAISFGIAKAQETLYPFSEKGKYGYINKSGKVIVPAQFQFAFLLQAAFFLSAQ